MSPLTLTLDHWSALVFAVLGILLVGWTVGFWCGYLLGQREMRERILGKDLPP